MLCRCLYVAVLLVGLLACSIRAQCSSNGQVLSWLQSGTVPADYYVGTATGTTDSVGATVSISKAGTEVIAGGLYDGVYNSGQPGAWWSWYDSGTPWTAQGSHYTPNTDPPGKQLGTGVVLAPDGKTALVGAPTDDIGFGSHSDIAQAGSVRTHALHT